jgi:hypothetical protein
LARRQAERHFNTKKETIKNEDAVQISKPSYISTGERKMAFLEGRYKVIPLGNVIIKADGGKSDKRSNAMPMV